MQLNYIGPSLHIGKNDFLHIGKNDFLNNPFFVLILNTNVIFHEFSHAIIAKMLGFDISDINIQHAHGHIYLYNCYKDLKSDPRFSVDVVLAAGEIGSALMHIIISELFQKEFKYLHLYIYLRCSMNLFTNIFSLFSNIEGNQNRDYNILFQKGKYAITMIGISSIAYSAYFAYMHCIIAMAKSQNNNISIKKIIATFFAIWLPNMIRNVT
jgi:hypothetical protein